MQVASEGRVWHTSNTDYDGDVREAIVERLDPSVTYKFRVSALFVDNENRWSGNSRRFRLKDDVVSSNDVTAPRTEPIIVRVSAVEDDGLEIDWQVRQIST